MYDSKEEEGFHTRHPHLVQCTGDYYPFYFYDLDGDPFRAKPDFYDPQNDCWIEFKCHQLNNYKTRALSEIAYNRELPFKKSVQSLRYLELKTAWSHSLHKQAKVQSSLSSTGKKMVVIFKDSTPLTTRSINSMAKAGLIWFYESDYFT